MIPVRKERPAASRQIRVIRSKPPSRPSSSLRTMLQGIPPPKSQSGSGSLSLSPRANDYDYDNDYEKASRITYPALRSQVSGFSFSRIPHHVSRSPSQVSGLRFQPSSFSFPRITHPGPRIPNPARSHAFSSSFLPHFDSDRFLSAFPARAREPQDACRRPRTHHGYTAPPAADRQPTSQQ